MIKAQDYHITFSGIGESISVDSVFVKNLTLGKTLELEDSDILHLIPTITGIIFQSGIDEDISNYPNPMQETSRLEFHNEKQDGVEIEIFNLEGKLIVSHSSEVYIGINIFDISGFFAGIYTANIITSTWQKSSSFISVSNDVKTPSIKTGSKQLIDFQTKSILKSTNNLVEMQYNDEDILLFKGIADDYARVLTVVPSQTQNINFEFVACMDLDSNNYAVVAIGERMAENLKYL